MTKTKFIVPTASRIQITKIEKQGSPIVTSDIEMELGTTIEELYAHLMIEKKTCKALQDCDDFIYAEAFAYATYRDGEVQITRIAP